MRLLMISTLSLAAAALAGCGSTLPGPDSLVVDVKVASTTAGGDVPFTFTNASAEQVVTGALGCVVTYEQRIGSHWVPVAPLRACIELAEVHPSGSERSYVTTAPEAGGLWRLVVEAYGRESVRVRSQAFMVVGED